MTISFSEIVDVSKIQELHDSIYKSFGILTAILDPDGTVLVSSGWNKICTEFHRKHPESAARCRESDIALAKPLGKNEKYKSYKCLNGLIDVAMPIYIEGEHIATLFTGQFFFEDPDVDFFRSQARMFGYDEKKYLDALQDVPVITRDEVDRHMSYLFNQAMLFIELGLKEKRYKFLVENQNDLIVTFDQNLCLQYVSPNYCKIWGGKEKEIFGKPFFPLIHDNDVEVVRTSIAALKNSPYSTYYEERSKTVDGWRWFGWSLKASVDNEGNMLETVGVGRDITKQKEAQEELRKSEEKYRELVENANSIIMRSLSDGTITFFNEYAQKFFGFDASEIIGKNIIGSIVPEKESTGRDFKQMVYDILKNPAKYEQNENENICKDGKRVWVNWTNRVVPDQNGNIVELLTVGTDITERKKSEEDLRKIEMMNRSLLEGSPVCNKVIDLDFKLRYMSNAGIKRLKIPDIELYYGQDYPLKFFCEETRITITEKLKIALTGKIAEVECLTHDSEGNELWFLHTFVPALDATGRVKHIIGSSVDITSRKQAEESNLRLIAAINQVIEIIIITNLEGNIEYVNPAFERITGYSREGVIGQKISILKSGKQDNLFYRDLWAIILRGDVWQGHFINKKKDGSLYDEEATITPVKNASGEIINFVAIKREVTEEIRIQEQLRQAQKMESIGTLAGGIAHDFNNILGVIMGCTELSIDDVEDKPTTRQTLQQVLGAAHRAKELVAQILMFSRSSKVEKKAIKVTPLVKETCKFLRSSLPTTIEIKQNITAKHDLIIADATQFHQTLMNLCTNAGHAMKKEGGILEVLLEEVFLQNDDLIMYPDLKIGPYLKLIVKDTGYGISQENLSRIFEPYFTTKGKGEGTGLGLAVVHGIVKDFGGDIRVSSEIGKGTVFYVLFPLLEEVKEQKDLERTKLLPTGTETILFVDDEEILFETGKLMLESLGYTVTAKNRSIEALETFQQTPDKFDMVITDQTMPHMTGYDMAKRMLEIKATVPIVLCTGYSNTVTPEKAEASGIKALIYKPISKKEIARTVREVFDKHNH